MKRISIISLALLLLLSLSSCGEPRTALLADGFQSRMEDMGCKVVDVSGQFSEEDAYESVLVASNEDGGYRIEFFVVTTEGLAIQAFNNVKYNFESEKGNSSSNSSVSVSNYNKYTQNTNDKYYVVSRIGNTFLYVVTESGNKDAVNSALKALGY